MALDISKAIFQDILRIREKINGIVAKMSEDLVVIKSISLKEPRFLVAIHTFYTTISWLYVWYYEVAKVNLDFLSERANGLKLDPNRHVKTHREIVHAFRTFLQHNINLEKTEDLAIQAKCYKWARMHTSLDEPETEEEWRLCLVALLGEAKRVFGILLEVVTEICNDEAREETFAIWRSRINRHHPAHEYDDIIQATAAEMGLLHVDAVALRKRYVQKWNRKLSVLKAGYDFEYEARRMIEHTLLNEESLPMPVTGKDIIIGFRIPPGPKVGALLQEAQKIFRAKPCTREELLRKLRELLDHGKEDDECSGDYRGGFEGSQGR